MGRWDSSDEEDGEVKAKQKAKRSRLAADTGESSAPPNGHNSASTSTAGVGVSSSTAGVASAHDAERPAAPLALSSSSSSFGSAAAQESATAATNTAASAAAAAAAAPAAAAAAVDDDPVLAAHNPLFYGCRSVDEYIRLNFIDQGTYGLVFKARCRTTGQIYALKQVKIGRECAKVGFPVTALREANILLALRHPNIVRVREMVVGTTIDKVFMVMEFGGLDLKACMDVAKKPFSTAEVKQLLRQFLSAVDHMHAHWYIHRDLKTSNLLYQNGVLCVCDFGLARKYGSPIAPYTFEVVTLWYRAPELLFGSRVYSTPLDMWSVGCIFAEMLTAQPLLPGEGELDQIAKTLRLLGAPSEETWPGVTALPDAGKINWKLYNSRGKLRDVFPTTSFTGGVCLGDAGFDLLSKLLTMNPATRITAADALRHPWFTEDPLPTPPDMMPRYRKKGDDDDGDDEDDGAQ